MQSDTRTLLAGAALTLWCTCLLGLSAATASCAESAGVSAAAQSQAADYLPLAVGNRWELRARNISDPMVLEVTGRDGDAFLVRWINPFVRATFRFIEEDTRVLLTGLDMGSGMGPIPAGTVYWDFGPAKGQEWSSPIGRGEVSDRGVSVNTPAGEFGDCIEVRTIDQRGQSMYWTFAPGTGLVRWGRGRDAYLLTSFQRGSESATPGTGARPNRRTGQKTGDVAVPRPSSRGGRGDGRLLIGLDANPHEKHGSGKSGKRAALQQAYEAGMTLLHIAPKWDQFEKSQGRYTFDDDTTAIGEFAAEHDLPIALNVRVIDTNQRSMPKDYSKWRFDDQRLADRLKAALRAFPPEFKRQTRYLAIGNEVEGYFNSHQREIGDYAELMRRVRDTARQEFPNAEFTVNFTFFATTNFDRYREIRDLVDFMSFTYYPLNADFTMRDPSAVRQDIERILDVSGDRRVYIQEIGYASAERLHSSPQKQAEFIQNAFDTISDHRDRIIGATFLFMSDLSQFVVDYLGMYYRLPNSENFKAYIQTLGLIERNGTPKPAWDVFRRRAQALKDAR